jgi:hypothetical protein
MTPSIFQNRLPKNEKSPPNFTQAEALWKAKALTEVVSLLREFDLTPEQIANLAADLPGEYAETVKRGTA